MRKNKVWAIVLLIATTLCIFSGCGNDSEESAPIDNVATESDSIGQAGTDNDPPTEKPVVTVTPKYEAFPTELSATKVGSYNEKSLGYEDECNEFGAIYKTSVDGHLMYGIISAEGNHDSGLIYTSCTVSNNAFVVRTEKLESNELPNTKNVYGLIDANGNVLVPFEYSAIESINDSYAVVYKLTGKAESDDEICYKNLKGSWNIYDIEAKKILSDIGGNEATSFASFGNSFNFTVKDENDAINFARYWKHENRLLTEDETLMENGFVVSNGKVFDENGNELFDKGAYVSITASDDFFIGKLEYADPTGNHVIEYHCLTNKGEVFLSLKNGYTPDIFGNFVFHTGTDQETLYDFDGNIIAQAEEGNVYFDKVTEQAWLFREGSGNTNIYKMIMKDGSVIYEAKHEKNNLEISHHSSVFFDAAKIVEGYKMHYCFATKDYTIEGVSPSAPWLVSDNTAEGQHLTDMISGNRLLSGYRKIHCVVGENNYVVYAQTQDSVVDVYIIK